jgi:hypothetical protein
MSRKQDEPRFIFHGNAMPFGGRIEKIDGKPHLEIIKGPPAGALAVVGGWSIATSRGSSHKDLFGWGATLADCKGTQNADGHFITTVTASIADFFARNEPHVFEAARISNTIVSNHVNPATQPTIAPKEIIFDGLMLDGKPIEVEFDHDFRDFPTFDAFEDKYRNHTGFFEKYQRCLKRVTGSANFGESLPRNPGGYVETTFVRGVRWNGQESPNHTLFVEGFGTLFFGEVLMNENNRRLTMVRLELGCPVQASAAAGETDPNGTFGN